MILTEILRDQWGFKGYVVSDCDSIDDIWKFHQIVATPAEAAAMGIKSGLEVNCGKTHAALTDALKKGLVTEAEIDIAVRRIPAASKCRSAARVRTCAPRQRSPSKTKWGHSSLS